MANKLQSDILYYLKTLEKCWAIKVISANERGCPDILCCYNGIFLAIEVKNTGDKLRNAQIFQINKINRAMGIAFKAESLQDVKNVLKSVCKKESEGPNG